MIFRQATSHFSFHGFVGNKLFARFQVESIQDSSVKEADHVFSQAVGVILEDVMATVLKLEDLGATICVVLVVLDDRVRSLS